MLTEEAHTIIKRADAIGQERGALETLRALSMDDYSELLFELHRYPYLASILPSMPPDDVQKRWCAASGMDLIKQTVAFARLVEEGYVRERKRPLRDISIFDLGCGWGNITRRLLMFTDPAHIWAGDPMESSLQHCRDYNVRANLFRTKPILTGLPEVRERVDLAIASSVFTHTSERTTRACMEAVRSIAAPGAVFVFTIRPVEFWSLRQKPENADEHRRTGFSFAGDGRMLDDGEDTYGHASMSHAFAAKLCFETGWRLARIDRTVFDEYQTRVIAVAN